MMRPRDVCGYRHTVRLCYRVSYGIRLIDRSIDEHVLPAPIGAALVPPSGSRYALLSSALRQASAIRKQCKEYKPLPPSGEQCKAQKIDRKKQASVTMNRDTPSDRLC